MVPRRGKRVAETTEVGGGSLISRALSTHPTQQKYKTQRGGWGITFTGCGLRFVLAFEVLSLLMLFSCKN